MRKTLIVGNWKLNKSISESIDLVTLLKREVSDVISADIVVCPVFTAITEVAEVLMDSNIAVGAQNLFWESEGAFTGEVSAPLLKDAGCKYVIVGHSERRQFFHDTDDAVNKKLKAVLNQSMTPIVCCGEKLSEREGDQTQAVLTQHIQGAFKGLSHEEASRTVIAYEPVWAIGTGKVATTEQAEASHLFIRGLIEKAYDKALADQTVILYGGSVKPQNAQDLMRQPDVDGFLVGGASLKAEDFARIIRTSIEVKV